MSDEIEFSSISNDTLVESSLARATAYVNTNGMIQVTLCGLFATTISVLIALAESDNVTSTGQIYARIIPAFCFVIFTVSINVYSWIIDQLDYLSKYGRKHSEKTAFLTYEQSYDLTEELWKKKGQLERHIQLWKETLAFYFTIPFRLNNVYCYYFMLYTLTPYLTIWRASDEFNFLKSAAILAVLQIGSARIGLRGALKKQIVDAELITLKRVKLTAEETTPVTENKDASKIKAKE